MDWGTLYGRRSQRAGIGGGVAVVWKDNGVAGRGHFQLRPECGKFLFENGIAEMVRPLD